MARIIDPRVAIATILVAGVCASWQARATSAGSEAQPTGLIAFTSGRTANDDI